MKKSRTLTEQIIENLLQINAVKLNPQNPFTWASGIQSPIYCDNRLILSYPSVRSLILRNFFEQTAAFEPFDVVAGVATAGIPWGVLLADRLRQPFIYIRDKPKSHGRQNQIEGILAEGSRVLIIEDLISTGGSSLKAVEAVREAGGVVAGVMAIFTYGFEEATSRFEAANCPLSTLAHYDMLLEKAVEMQYITANDLQTLQQWRLSPQTWSANKI